MSQLEGGVRVVGGGEDHGRAREQRVRGGCVNGVLVGGVLHLPSP